MVAMEETGTPALQRRRLLVIVIAVVCILILSGGAFAVYQTVHSRLRIPESATQGVTFPLYIPKKLPIGYVIDEKSFKYVPSENVFLFQAQDTAGDTLVFSEQRKPSGVSFDDFADKQLVEPKKLANLPFTTIVGKTLDKQTTLASIVTPTTWVIITTQAELSNQQLHDVAAGMVRY